MSTGERRITEIKHGYRLRMALPDRLVKRLKRNSYSKSFTMPTYKTLEDCKAAAIEHRNSLEQRWNLTIKKWELERGISRQIKASWVAHWREGPPDKRLNKSKTFYFDFCDPKSEEKAKSQAREWRRLMKKLHG